jgi:uncharacterized protein YndB with AHSA1/START domain
VTSHESDVVEREIYIAARPETIFSFFTDPAKIVRWLGIRAQLNPQPGGIFRININERDILGGKYLEVEPYSRVVFTWGWEGSPLPLGSTTVEITLVPDAVIESLVRFFGSAFEPAASIVHSTSWRYCIQTGRIILTFLVVLPQRSWMRCWTTSGRIITQRLGKVEQAHGDNLHPPDRIELDNLLAHALDHLALLHSYDESIMAVLESAWLKVLQKRQPKPAGYLTLR